MDIYQAKNRYRYPVSGFVLNCLLLLVVLGLFLAVSYLLGISILEVGTGSEGQGTFIMGVLLFPFALIVIIVSIFPILFKIFNSPLKTMIMPEAIYVSYPFREMKYDWSVIDDFELLPGSFCEFPQQLILYSEFSGKGIKIDRKMKNFREAIEQISLYFPLLKHWDFDQVKIIPEKERQRYKKEQIKENILTITFMIPGGSILCLILLLGITMVVVGYLNYNDLLKNGIETQAKILDWMEEKSGDTTDYYVKIEFRDKNGTTWKDKIEVIHDFDKHFRIGDNVAVLYDQSKPTNCTIKGWTSEGRSIYKLILLVPFFYLLLNGMIRMIKGLFQAKFSACAIQISENSDRNYSVYCSALPLFTILKLFEKRIKGHSVCISNMADVHKENLVVANITEKLKKVDLNAAEIADTFIVIDALSAEKLLKRNSLKYTFDCDLFCIPEKELDDAKNWVLANIDEEKLSINNAKMPFEVRNNLVYPNKKEELKPVVNSIINHSIRLLTLFDIPENMLLNDYFAFFNHDVETGDYLLGFLYRRNRIEMYLQTPGDRLFNKMVFENGSWTLVGKRRKPMFLRSGVLDLVLFLLMGLPLIIFVLIHKALTFVFAFCSKKYTQSQIRKLKKKQLLEE